MNIEKANMPDVYTRKPFMKRMWEKYVTNNPASYLFWAFLLPAAIMFVLYAALGTYPFGTSSVLVLDLNGQYVYFFEALRDIVYGEGSLLYSFGRALGGEFLGIYAYYLASPLSYIVCLFPKHAILEALYLMFVLKCGFCGLTFGYYIHRSGKVQGKAATVMFACMYALCGYCVVYQHNTMWIDCVILLPLVALGIELLISERKYTLFTVSLALAILSNFYIGYMMCFFVFAYSIFAYFSRTQQDNNPYGERFHFIRAVSRVLVFSVIAIAISMMITMPAVYALSFGKDDFQNPNFSPTQRFDFLDLFSRFFIGAYDTVRPEGLPIVYCGLLAVILLPVYFLCHKRPVRERIGTICFIAFFVMCFNFNPVDMAWHGFQIPNWLNYRYSFMLCFVILVAGRKAYDELKENGPRTILTICSILGLVLIIMQKINVKHLPDFEAVWLSLAFLVVYCIGLSLASKTKTKETTAMIMTVIVCLEMFCAGLLNLVDLDEDVVISSYTSYHEFIDGIQPIVDEVKKEDDSFYRMEKNDHRKVNDPYALGFRGLSGSTSTLNKETILFLQRMGYSSKSHWSKYLGGTPLSDSLLGIKYLVAKTDDTSIDPLWGELFKTDEENGYNVYLNPYAMSIAYAVDNNIKDLYFSDPNPEDAYNEESGEEVELIPYKEINNPFERMNAMVTAMLGEEEEIKLFKSIRDVKITTDNINLSFAGGHKKYTPVNSQTDASLQYEFEAESNGIVYCYFTSKYPREVNVFLNGSSYGTYYGNETNRILSLGQRRIDENIRVKLTLTKDDLYIMSGEEFFWYLDEEVYADVMTRLTAGNMAIEKYTERYFKGTVNTTADKSTVFTSLPYDEGWKVYVDGERVEIFKSLDALIAFDIPNAEAGEHEIVMKYSPAAFTFGVAITVLGSIALLIAVIFKKQIRQLFADLFPDDKYPNGYAEIDTEKDSEQADVSANSTDAVSLNANTDLPNDAQNSTPIIPDSEVIGAANTTDNDDNRETNSDIMT